MSPSQRAARLEQELDALATLAERTADVQRKAVGVGIEAVKLGPDLLEAVAKRIRHLQADLGVLITVNERPDGDHCAECGELLRGV